ncbi:MAG: hypothetical protein IJ917_01960 [Firmicutes bacterium]|nr:hypothetical protein [Bacillota bacterium]
MQKYNLNLGWQFRDNNQMFAFPGAPGMENQNIDLPHDFIYTKPRSAEAAGGSPNGYSVKAAACMRRIWRSRKNVSARGSSWISTVHT